MAKASTPTTVADPWGAMERFRIEAAQRAEEQQRELLALRASKKELQAYFEVLVECLRRNGIQADMELQRSCSVWVKKCLSGVLVSRNIAHRIFEYAGLAAWAAVEQASTSERRSAAAVQQERIYAVGGEAVHAGPLDTLLKASESFSPASDTWTATTPLPTRSLGRVGAVLGRCLYLCGGYGDFGRVAMKFSPARKKWQHVPSMSVTRGHAAAATLGQCLYVLGGSDGEHVWTSVERFNPKGGGARRTGAWEAAPDMLSPRRGHAAVVLRGSILALGGQDQPTSRPHLVDQGKMRSVEVLGAADERKYMPSMTSPRSFHGAAVLDDTLYVTGGAIPIVDILLSTVETYDPEARAWTERPAMRMTRPRWGHAAVAYAGELYVLGGHHRLVQNEDAERSVERLDPATCYWEELQPMEVGRASFVVALMISLGPAPSAM